MIRAAILVVIPASFLLQEYVLGDRPRPLARTVAWATIGAILGVFIYFGFDDGWLGSERPLGTGLRALESYGQIVLVALAHGIDNLLCIAFVLNALVIPARHHGRVLGRVLPLGVVLSLAVATAIDFVPVLEWVPAAIGGVFVLLGLWTSRGHRAPLEERAFVRKLRRELRITDERHNGRFILRSWGSWRGTRLLLAVVLLEPLEALATSDSLAAVVTVSREPLLVGAGACVSVLWLRAIYPWVAGRLSRAARPGALLGAVWCVNGVGLLARVPLASLLGASSVWIVSAATLLGGLVCLLVGTAARTPLPAQACRGDSSPSWSMRR